MRALHLLHSPASSRRVCSQRLQPRRLRISVSAAFHSTVELPLGVAELSCSASSASSDFRVVVIPGNPGVASYYDAFTDCLSEELHALVITLSLVGHSRARSHRGRLILTLTEQIESTLAYLDSQLDGQRLQRLVLVGHSIGSYVALRCAALRPAQMYAVCCLYPFLCVNRNSLLQALLAFLVRQRWLVRLVSWMAEAIALLPKPLRAALLRPPLRALGLDDAAQHITCDWVCRDSTMSTCVLAASEFDTFEKQAQPAYETLDGRQLNVAMLYGPADDVWAPRAHAEAASGFVAALRLDDTHPHMFCTSQAGSRHVAVVTAELVNALLAEPQQQAATQALATTKSTLC